MKETNHERERKEILPPVLSPWCRLCDVTPRVAPAQTARWWRLTEGHRGRISDQRKPRWGVPLPHILYNSQGPFSSPTSTLIQEAHACFNTYNNRFKRKKMTQSEKEVIKIGDCIMEWLHGSERGEWLALGRSWQQVTDGLVWKPG